jgi:ribonuclease P protein component
MLSLNRNFDFRRVFDQGKSAGGHFAVLYAYYHGEGETYYGFIASKKALGKRAVDRNRARRRLKEAVRQSASMVPPGYHLVFICRKPLLEGDFKEIGQGVIRLLTKTGVLK